jgi:hypothetical protein
MNCAEANQIDLVEYLDTLGFQPERIRNNDYWYLSPLRVETTLSFKVNKVLNRWYDHGEGKGGNLLDSNFSFHQHKSRAQKPANAGEKGHTKVIHAREIISPELIKYLSQRKIPLDVAKASCKEVDFVVYNKKYTAIGFKNNSGGYELRNEYFKGSSSPKDVTIISNNSENISVFEGLFSLLSFQALHQNNSTALTNFLVLNSLSFFEKSRDLMEQHQQINLYLDRDVAGIKHAQKALRWSKKYIDKSQFYQNHKDLNDYLIHQGHQQKYIQKLGKASLNLKKPAMFCLRQNCRLSSCCAFVKNNLKTWKLRKAIQNIKEADQERM